MSILDEAITAYSVVTRQNTSSTLNSNHEWLLLLRRRSISKISQSSSGAPKTFHAAVPQLNGEKPDEDVDEELLGWRTRLIERAVKSSNQQKATTIVSSSDRGSNMSVDMDAMTTTVDSTPPFLSMLFLDNQLPSADLMMHQHFALSPEFGRRLDENDRSMS